MRSQSRPAPVSSPKNEKPGPDRLVEELRREFALPPEVCAAIAERCRAWVESGRGREREAGQILFKAASADAPTGVRKRKTVTVPVILTLYLPQDRRAGSQDDLLNKRILRLTREAREQGARLTQKDLSVLLGLGVRTLQRHLKALETKGERFPARGWKGGI